MCKALWAAGAALGLLLAPRSVDASGGMDIWFLGVTPSDQSREYIDAGSIAPESGSAWTARIASFMPGSRQGAVLLNSDVEVDCAKHAYRYLHGVSYDVHGHVVQRIAPRQSDWAPTAREPGAKQVESFVCGDTAWRNNHFRRPSNDDPIYAPSPIAIRPAG